MAKCTKQNALGGFIADAELAGKIITEDALQVMTVKEKLGYAGRSTRNHLKGVKENPSDAIKKQMQTFKDLGLKQNGLGGTFRDPLVLFGDDIRPITEAGKTWKETVLSGGLSQKEARKLYNETVVPVVKEQQKAVFEKDPQAYYKYMANKYFEDMIEGVELFGGDETLVASAARKGAGYFTGYAPHIALYDVGELVTKGITRFGPWHFTKGLATALIKSKGKILGQMPENKTLYIGVDYASDKSNFKQGAAWLLEHINPQYYSNNLLVNGSAEMARSAGMDAAEGVRKVGFIKEIGNTPAYLRRGGAEITWARYSTEAAKFYIDIHADLGRAIASKDPKAFTGALGSVLMYHGTMTALAGVGSSLPTGTQKLLNIITDSTDEDNLFARADEAVPFSNMLTKATGVDAKKGMQIGAPAFGLSYGAAQGLFEKFGSNEAKIKEALDDGDNVKAFGYALEGAQSLAALKWRNPLLTKTAKNMVILGNDYWSDELETADKIELFTGKGTAVGF